MPLHPTSLFLFSLLPLAHTLSPSPGCNSTPKLLVPSALVNGTTSPALRLTINNKAREFFVNLPSPYNVSHPHRLVMTLHALGGNAGQVVAGTSGYERFYGLPALFDADPEEAVKTIYVAPNGLNNGWGNQGGEDVSFLKEVIAAVEGDVCVDRDLRFSTGFSYGAAMSYSLACSMGRELRAVAVLSGNPQISGCAAGKEGSEGAVAYLGVHGTSDNVLPISGGRQMRDRFLKANGCGSGVKEGTEPAKGSSGKTKTVYEGCEKDKPVVWIAFDGPHTPTPKEKGESETWAPRETWEFFRQFK